MFKHLKTMINPIGDINDTTNLNTAPTILDLISHTAGFSYHFLGDPVGIAYYFNQNRNGTTVFQLIFWVGL